MIEVTPDSIECCCPCHSLSRKALSRLRDSRARLQAECEMLHRRREVMLHQLTQIHQRSNLIYTPVVCIYRAPDQRVRRAVENNFDFGVTARRIHWRAIMDGGNDTTMTTVIYRILYANSIAVARFFYRKRTSTDVPTFD